MIGSIHLRHLGPIRSVAWEPAPGFNVVIGVNDAGKTLLLKSLYAAVRSQEEFGRGQDARTFRQVVDDKLTWTFQAPRLGDLVTKGADGPCEQKLTLDGLQTRFRFTARAEKGVGAADTQSGHRDANSVFIPAKEVMSMLGAIKEARAAQKFGFDDPTFDLVRALEREPSQGAPPFGSARQDLEELVGGRLLERNGKGWVFKAGRHEHPVAITAEGIKKIAIIDRLIVNRTLSKDSILFLDEPEAFLHPQAVVQVLDILSRLVESGVQIFMATHSYFVLKKLLIIAHQRDASIPVLSLAAGGMDEPWLADLREGMPDSPIVETSLALYEQELDATFHD